MCVCVKMALRKLKSFNTDPIEIKFLFVNLISLVVKIKFSLCFLRFFFLWETFKLLNESKFNLKKVFEKYFC